MSKQIELENAFHEAIQRYCATDDDTTEIKTYFENMMINEMIDDVLED